MRAPVFAVVLVLAFAPVPYVRREWRPRPAAAARVVGSRDRTLPGKARRRARRAT